MTAFSVDAFRAAVGDAAVEWKVEVRDETSSTNTLASEFVRAGASSGLIVIADTQRAGRGRRGRSWLSPSGENLFLSLFWEWPSMAEARLAVYAAGVAAARSCASETGVSPLVKWPNDLHVDGRKLCGILCESMASTNGVGVIVGIGMNVNAMIEDFPPSVAPFATSLALLDGTPHSRERVAARLVQELRSIFGWLSTDSIAVLDEWHRWARVPGTRYRLCDDAGHEYEGVARGLAADGALLLSTAADDVIPIYSADVISYEVA